MKFRNGGQANNKPIIATVTMSEIISSDIWLLRDLARRWIRSGEAGLSCDRVKILRILTVGSE